MLKNKIMKNFSILIMLLFSMNFVSAQPPAQTAAKCYESWQEAMAIINNTVYDSDCQAMIPYMPAISSPPTVEEFITFTLWYEEYDTCSMIAEYKYFQDVNHINTLYDECMERVPVPNGEG